ncbi:MULTISPECIES: hypothetical protein [unclassified Bacteroides]|jgi:hypothetical protein|uniref:hypothetical protein n=1 Tax=unclassified Bacteroides TaxID=2646097 RepID=UPI000E88DB92|nr:MULTISPECIES: hypothetical protein [unclassified Bacteroides]RGN42098.1 hypothetical protein DXB63_17390 [Bacteroides sp. OM05-12]RHR68794.1 hypothetical protein DWW69_19670 [Bacteroides sp. AF16-49]
MDRILFGDNQFFAVNHLSDERSRAQAVRFKDNSAIIDVLDTAMDLGINTFMCTTHDRIAAVCEHMRQNPEKYKDFKFHPCMPYAHKYANAVTELGILGTLKAYIPGNILAVASKAGIAYMKKDYPSLMELLVDAEMKMFKGMNTPVIFLQNVIVDLLLGLGMDEIIKHYADYIKKEYNAEPGFITMNLPGMVDLCERLDIKNPIICSSINKIGFRMSNSIEEYEEYLNSDREFRPIAMQVLAAGALKPEEAIEYVCRFAKIESILFGASSRGHIQQTKELIEKYSGNR